MLMRLLTFPGLFLLATIVPVISAQQHNQVRKRELAFGEVSGVQRSFDDAKNLWYKDGNLGSYRYNLIETCVDCDDLAYPWRVQMHGGSAAQALDSNGQKRTALSVAQTFDKLEAAIDSDSFFATYDDEYGYPNRYRIFDGSASGVVSSSIYGFQFETGGSPQKQLTENRAIWDSQRLVNYDFSYFQSGPNPSNIQWPLFVKVRNSTPVQTKDRNGNVVNWLTPQTFDQLFDMIQRQIDKDGTFVDNDYSKRGFPREVVMVADDVGEWNLHFCTFSDAVGSEL